MLHRRLIMGLGFLLGLWMSASLSHAFPLWVDAPSRGNGNDPKALHPNSTATPTYTFTATGPTNTPTNTPITPTNTPTNTAGGPTPTNTNTPTFNGTWFDGETYLTGSGSYSTPAGQAGLSLQTTGGDHTTGTGHYEHVTVAVTTGGYFASANFATSGNIQDLSSYSTMDFWFRIPTSGGGCFHPAVELVLPGGTHSRPVTCTTYVSPQGSLYQGAWLHCVLPLSAFNGPNGDATAPFTFAAANLTGVANVAVMPDPSAFDSNGNYTGSVDVDDMKFTTTAAPANHDFGNLFADFEYGAGKSNWGTYWYWFTDQWNPATSGPAFTPPCSTVSTSNTYPSGPIATAIKTPPVDTMGDTMTPCHGAHLAGVLGGGGPTDCGGHYSYIGMGCSFNPAGTAINFPTALPWIGEHGIIVSAMLGPNDAGNDYHFVIHKQSVITGGGDWYFDMPASQLSMTSWTTKAVPFPAVGTQNQDNNAPAPWVFYTPQWAPAVNWDMTDLMSLQVSIVGYKTAFDIYIDDVQFY